jgi:hypothetical protein
LSKEDPECAHLRVTETLLRDEVYAANDLSEVAAMVAKPSDYIGMRSMWEDRPIEPIPQSIQPKEWHLRLAQMLESDPDRRTIYWFVDPVGGVGKTEFCDWYSSNHPNQVLVIADFGKTNDVATIVYNAQRDGNKLRVVIADLPRGHCDKAGMYQHLENIKNGRMTVVKYQGRTIQFNKPHLIVFANFEPMMNMLSWDRWYIITLQKQANEVQREVTRDVWHI